MKKFIAIICVCLLTFGCGEKNSPTKQVEMFMGKYQTLDAEMLSDLEESINQETNFNEEQKKTYKDIMKKHYQELTYSVKNEEIDGDKATVKVEIEVVDFSKVLEQADQALRDNPNQFYDETGAYNVYKFTDYRLELLKQAKEKVKYTLDLTLTKSDKKWTVNALTDTEESKLNGTYNY